RQEPDQLWQAIDERHGLLSPLAATLANLSQRDAKIRVLANLEPIGPSVQAAGIGGPVLASRPVLPHEGPALRRSQEIRVDLDGLIRRADLLALSFEDAKDSLASRPKRL